MKLSAPAHPHTGSAMFGFSCVTFHTSEATLKQGMTGQLKCRHQETPSPLPPPKITKSMSRSTHLWTASLLPSPTSPSRRISCSRVPFNRARDSDTFFRTLFREAVRACDSDTFWRPLAMRQSAEENRHHEDQPLGPREPAVFAPESPCTPSQRVDPLPPECARCSPHEPR